MNLANNYYKNQNNISSYDKKYLGGKSYYDDLFDESFIKLSIKSLHGSYRVLEVGSYTGRISKKLEKYGILFDQSDIHKEAIYTGPNTQQYYQVELEKDLPEEIIKNKYDLIISLGHQISFTNNIEIAINNLSKLLNTNGLLVFDIWQESSANMLPEYEIQTSNKLRVINILKENNLNLKKVFYGQTLIYFLNNYLQGIISKYSKYRLFRKVYFYIDRYFVSKIPFLNLSSQSIIFFSKND